MNEKIRLMNVVGKDVYKVGRFTIMHLKDDKGNSAVGIARLSDLDAVHEGRGVSIAQGRAERALYLKRKHKSIQHWYMG